MKIIDKYIIRQYLTTFFFMLGMVIALTVLVDFVEKIDDFIDRQVSTHDVIFVYYANFIPYYGNLLSPVCIFLSVIFVTSRLANRSELVPMLSAGVSFYRILVPYLITSVILAGVSFYFKAYIVPESAQRRIAFEYTIQDKKSMGSNRNIHKKVAEDTYLYINYYNEERMEGHNFTLERLEDGDIADKIHANQIQWVDSLQKWRLLRVTWRDFKSGDQKVNILPRIDTTFLLKPDDIYIIEHKEQTLTLPDLYEYIRLEELRGSDILRELYLERHRRYAYPVAVIILSLIGFAMSSRKSRGGTALQIGLGLLICFAYIVLLLGGEAISGGEYPPWLAVWMPNILFLFLSFFLLRVAPK